jgi:hypothetical protein
VLEVAFDIDLDRLPGCYIAEHWHRTRTCSGHRDLFRVRGGIERREQVANVRAVVEGEPSAARWRWGQRRPRFRY